MAEPSKPRRASEARILEAAAEQFAERGFRGARVGEIAERAGLPKANVLYYYPSKEALYRAVIDHILGIWLAALDDFSEADEPADVLRRYIRRKMELSRDEPNASRIFANEIISGAPVIGDYLRTDLRDWVAGKAALFRRWQAAGKMAKIDPEHLFFAIWAATQTYADFRAQMEAVLGVDALGPEDFERGVETVTRLVMAGCGLDSDKT